MSVKSIRFKGEITSNGIVNFDGETNYFTKQALSSRNSGDIKFNNIKYAKHQLVEETNEKGEKRIVAKLKISKECIRQSIFKNDQPFHNPNIIYAPIVMYQYLSSPAAILRGYLFATNDPIIKRKSPVFISDAVQTSNNVSTIDISTLNCPKDKKESADDDSSLSRHYKETISGLTTYEFEGAIDLCELQFISTTQMYDRLAIDPQYKETYIKNLEEKIGPVEQGYFIKNTSTNGLPEQGILLNSDQVKFLVFEFFNKLLDFEVSRGSNGIAWLSNLEVMFKENGIVNKEYKKVENKTDLESGFPEIFCFFDKYSEDEAVKLYDELESDRKKAQKEKNDVKLEKKLEKEKNKKAKISENKEETNNIILEENKETNDIIE